MTKSSRFLLALLLGLASAACTDPGPTAPELRPAPEAPASGGPVHDNILGSGIGT